MPDLDEAELERQLEALQRAHPGLEPLAALVLLAVRRFDPSSDEEASDEKARDEEASGKAVSTSRLSRALGIEHALIRRAAAELEAAGLVDSQPVGGASPALRLRGITAGAAPPASGP